MSLPLLLLALADAVAAQPVVSSASPSTISRSGRLLIGGSGFGAPDAASRVEIGGLDAPVTRWSDTLITAYVPEAVSLGSTTVRIFAGGVFSNAVSLTVTLRQSSGRVKWRFQADADYILQRPAIGPDGTIVAHDSAGHVYALTQDGGLKWIFSTRPNAAGPPSVDADGTVYVASGGTIDAINQDGSLKWEFTEPPGGQGVIAGPTVGPDGDIYAVTDQGGLGALALSPAGQLLWSNSGDPEMQETAQVGVEMVFGPSQSGGPIDQFYVAFDDYTSAPSSRLYGFSTKGLQSWVIPLYLSKDTFMFGQQQPEVGPDGRVFLPAAVATGASWSLNAFSAANGALSKSFFPSPGNGVSVPSIGSDGRMYMVQSLSYLQSLSSTLAPKWQYFDGSILAHPIVSPANDIVVTGGASNFGVPGFARAFSTRNGQLLWSLDLGVVNGGNQSMESIPRFDAAGTTVYFGTVIAGSTSSDTFCYLYALDTSATAPATPPGRVDSLDVSMNPDGISLDLSWTPSCSGAATDYEVMEGIIGSWSSYAPVLCSSGGATSATIVPSSSLTFYLIVPRSGNVEGSYGLDLNGNERPRSMVQCVTSQALGGCL